MHVVGLWGLKRGELDTLVLIEWVRFVVDCLDDDLFVVDGVGKRIEEDDESVSEDEALLFVWKVC